MNGYTLTAIAIVCLTVIAVASIWASTKPTTRRR